MYLSVSTSEVHVLGPCPGPSTGLQLPWTSSHFFNWNVTVQCTVTPSIHIHTYSTWISFSGTPPNMFKLIHYVAYCQGADSWHSTEIPACAYYFQEIKRSHAKYAKTSLYTHDVTDFSICKIKLKCTYPKTIICKTTLYTWRYIFINICNKFLTWPKRFINLNNEIEVYSN